MRKNYVADNIMADCNKKIKYKINQKRLELEEFIRKECKNCKNKKTNLCKIRRNIDGHLQCVNKKN